MTRRQFTTDRLTPAGRKFYAQVEKLKRGPHVKIGINQDKFKEPKEEFGGGVSPFTLGQVAVVNEFGSKDGRVPERSFIRTTDEDKRDDISTYLRRRKLDVVSGRQTAKQVLGEVGAKMKGFIQNKIIAIRTPPNAPSTIARKDGKSNPLIAEGQLLRSIEWEYHESD